MKNEERGFRTEFGSNFSEHLKLHMYCTAAFQLQHSQQTVLFGSTFAEHPQVHMTCTAAFQLQGSQQTVLASEVIGRGGSEKEAEEK